MKRFIGMVLAVATVAVLTAVWFPYWLRPAPERAAVKMMDALGKANYAKAERYTTGGLGFEFSGRRARKLYRAMGKTMRYTVTKTAREGDAAQVTLLVTMVDMTALLEETSYQLLGESLEGKHSETYYKLLTERIGQGDAATETNAATLQLVKGEKGWRVDVGNSKGFLSAVTGGAGPF